MPRLITKGQSVTLYVRFTDAAGNPINTDAIPEVRITDADGNVTRAFSNIGVSLAVDPGVYSLSYSVPLSFADGYATDTWRAAIGGESVESSFEFLAIDGGAVSADEVLDPVLGDDVEFVFTNDEIRGINCLLKILRKRLKSDGVVKVPDGLGGFIDQPCPIFKDSELICFLINSLSEFNQYPHFTDFGFADELIQNTFSDIIIQGAVILALAAQTLIEKGREFSITDNGVTYQPPQVSDILNTQYSAQLQDYKEKLKMIKANIKPKALGLGTFRVTSVNPNYLRLRHLRARQIV